MDVKNATLGLCSAEDSVRSPISVLLGSILMKIDATNAILFVRIALEVIPIVINVIQKSTMLLRMECAIANSIYLLNYLTHT